MTGEIDIDRLKEEVKRSFAGAKGSHDWDHTERVYRLCMHIGDKEGADMDILKLAALLHDIGRSHEDSSNGKVCHAEKGAELARDILKRHGVGQERIDRIAHCIECHRFRNSKVPESREAKIVFDSDKLDAIGAVGVGRAFLFAGEVGARLHNSDVEDIEKTEAYGPDDTAYREFMVKLKKVKDRMQTGEGKRLAEARHDFMVRFFERLEKEIQGDM